MSAQLKQNRFHLSNGQRCTRMLLLHMLDHSSQPHLDSLQGDQSVSPVVPFSSIIGCSASLQDSSPTSLMPNADQPDLTNRQNPARNFKSFTTSFFILAMDAVNQGAKKSLHFSPDLELFVRLVAKLKVAGCCERQTL